MDEQAYCILSAMRFIVDTLKAKGVFEDSLVVFKSDHGPERLFYTKGGLASTGIHGHNLLGYIRYRPFVMVKYPKQNAGVVDESNLVVDDRVFFLGDLSKIYCDFWTKAGGVSQGTCERPQDEFSQPHFYLAKTKDSSYQFADQFSVEASRNMLKNIEIFENVSK
jgi:arylsulfatase A-like enzyme